MGFERTDRISEEVRRALDKIIRGEVNDPRVCGTWSITHADVTRDLRYCRVRVSVLEEELRKDMLKALKNAAGFIRHELGARVDLRYTPELQWQTDDSIVQGAHILDILSKLDIPEDEHEDAEHS